MSETLQTQSPGDDLVALRRILDARISCRAYLPGQVPEATIRQVMQTAQRTASWCNSQPWQVTITRGAATDAFRKAYAEAAAATPPHPDFKYPTEYRGLHLDRRRACGWQLYDSVGVVKGDREGAEHQRLQNYALFGAPHVAIITSDSALGIYGAVDCGAYVANFMNAATALGLGCIAQAALASHPDTVRRQLGLSDDRLVVCGISFGFPDMAAPVNGFRTARADLSEVMTFVD